MHINRLCIIGVGLIGGSLARALRAASAVTEIVGCGRSADELVKAKSLGVIDIAETNIARAAQGADIVVVAVPVGAMESVFSQLASKLAPATILTDVGSTKGNVVAAAQRVFGTLPPAFVPGHPIAGTEKNGVEASFAELYRGRKVILTPNNATDANALQRVHWMWAQTGAQVLEMDAQHHDEVLAATSHLPHMLAFTLVHTLANMRERDEIFKYAAGGFRDFTRIASSDPHMWRDIALANRDALLSAIQRFNGELAAVEQAVKQSDGDALLRVFEQAKQARDRFIDESDITAKTQSMPRNN